MANRLWVLLSVLAAAGLTGACSVEKPKAPELPQSISPGWRLANFQIAEMKDAPEAVRAVHPQAAWSGSYTGPGTAHVRVWAIAGAPGGLDLVQNWQPEPNTVVLYSDRYFAAVDWMGVDRTQAGALVRAVERAIGHQAER